MAGCKIPLNESGNVEVLGEWESTCNRPWYRSHYGELSVDLVVPATSRIAGWTLLFGKKLWSVCNALLYNVHGPTARGVIYRAGETYSSVMAGSPEMPTLRSRPAVLGH